MVNEKSNWEKSIAILSTVILFADFFFIFCDVVITFLTRQYFLAIFEQIGSDQLPVIAEFLVVSIPTIAYCIFIASLILILVLKELYLRAKMVTLVINIVVGIAAIAYIPIYIAALYLPVIALS